MACVQRRRAVVGAHRTRFKSYPEKPDEFGWYVPPFYRKTTKRGSRAHLVPVVGFGAAAVRGLLALSDDPKSEKNAHHGWLFPGRGKENPNPADSGLLNDALEVMPGVSWSPHGVRYVFADFVGTLEGFKYSDAKVVLDHMEGIEPDDVTGMFYSSNPDIARKRTMMTAWVAYLDGLCKQAVAEDACYADADWIREQMYVKRYPDRVARRIESRRALGLETWGAEKQRR